MNTSCLSAAPLLVVLALVTSGPVSAQVGLPPVSYTVSMPAPASHVFHVTMRAAGLRGETQDVKMPAWHPGYYRLIDYAKHVTGFSARDGAGRPLAWARTTKNTWRIVTSGAATVVIDYDVLGTTRFSAQNYLDDARAFMAPTGMFLHVAGQLRRPATVTVRLPDGWTKIATGLEPVPGRPDTFRAPDLDTLYDSPLLLGNQETFAFDVRGIRHTVALEDVPAAVDRVRMASNLKRMVETAVSLMGDLPYARYTFLMMGQGAGGIEHANSSANHFNGKSLSDESGYQRWLSFIAHEYFHHYNVKRIRPIALGPFDYDTENLTGMLWVSEGLTVYYEGIVLVRAGLQTPDQYLDRLAKAISTFENAPGHRFQSATDSSLTTWGTSGVGNDRNTTISYYDNGAMLGAMLDLAIRQASGNRKSLDDVMRSIYRVFYQQKHRGFTDDEFRQACESAAGTSLAEVFDYASTTKDVDYAKYLAYAGLELVATSEDASGAFLGLNLQTREGTLVVVGASEGSPAAAAGLVAQDQLVAVDGVPATPKLLNDALAARKAGDTVTLKVIRAGAGVNVPVTLAGNRRTTYTIRRVSNPTPQQGAILAAWLKTR